MTDHIPAGITPEEAKKAREWALRALNKPGSSTTAEKAVARVVIGTVPEPRPTLADMTDDERAECRWMQCDVGVERRIIIRVMDEEEGAVTLTESGDTVVCPHDRVTPRPDLPRLTWPGDKKPAPAPAPALPGGWRLADHKMYGRVIVTTQTPNSNGYVYLVIPDAGNFTGYDWRFCDPNRLTYLDTEPEADQ